MHNYLLGLCWRLAMGAELVYEAMRKLAIQQQQESLAQAAAPAATAAADEPLLEDGEEAEGATDAVAVRLPADFSLPERSGPLLETLSRVVYSHGTDNQKGQAVLCGVYWR